MFKWYGFITQIYADKNNYQIHTNLINAQNQKSMHREEDNKGPYIFNALDECLH